MMGKRSWSDFFHGDRALVFGLALLPLLLLVLCHGRYGYFRDELYYIACSNHLALGYVDQPPLSILLLKVVRWLLGDSLHAIRLLPALAVALTVALAGLTARKLGGGRLAQVLAALAVITAPIMLGSGRYFSMNAFDLLFWALAGYLVIVILHDDKPRLWPLFGLVVGLGLLNKYSIGFFIAALVVGLLLSPQRKQLATKWFWLAGLIALLLFLPHLIWEIRWHFPSLEWMRRVTQFKNMPLAPLQFIWSQFFEVNLAAAPVWLLGVWFFLFSRQGRSFRPLGWSYVLLLVVMVAVRAKPYYLAPIYPLLFAAGAPVIENWTRQPRRLRLKWVKPVLVGLILVWGLILAPFAVPLLPVETFIRYQKLLNAQPRTEERGTPPGILPQHYADMFGWPELAAQMAGIFRTLTPEEQSRCLIYTRNYGEAGAIDFFGRVYGLPRALCGHNSYWSWGPDDEPFTALIVIGDSNDLQENLADLGRGFGNVELAGTTACGLCMPYENNRQIFLCREPRFKFKDIWPEERFYI